MSKVDGASNLELLIELMYSGQSGIVPSLAEEEPIDVDLIVGVLASRTEKSGRRSFEDWYTWFLSDASGETDSDKEILENLAEFKSKFDDIVERIRRR